MENSIQTAAEHEEAQVLRLGKAVIATPDAALTAEQEPLPPAVAAKPVEQKSPAEWAYQRLILYIKNFENTLDDEHEIAMGFTDTGAGFLRIEGLGYFDPDIVTFYGADLSGARMQLAQHVSQLNVLLRAMPKAIETAEPRRIGFELAKSLDEDESA